LEIQQKYTTTLYLENNLYEMATHTSNTFFHLKCRYMPSVAFPVKNGKASPEVLSSIIAGQVGITGTFSTPHKQKSEAVSSGEFVGQKSL
jgi:hypothetical protein